MKQHFVPEFYLKNFTDEDGLFYIYNVRKGRFKKGDNRFSPASHFFVPDINTVFSKGNASYFVENSFTKHDTLISNIFAKIKERGATQLIPAEWTHLQYFTNILYWRNPNNTAQLEDLVTNAKNLSVFGAKLINKTTGERESDDRERELIKDPQFIRFLRGQMPGITYPEIFTKQEQDHATIITFPDGLPKLVSDNPVISLHEQGQSLHTSGMIFPLTPTKVLFRHDRRELIVQSFVKVMIDMLLPAQATNYVSCTDQSYVLQLLENYRKHYSSVDLLKDKFRKLLQ
ncbi:MAG: DUF4238 domain-containing protein [Puia sp.]|nr:DUF4238 domain-containing protein [Puia sp.]